MWECVCWWREVLWRPLHQNGGLHVSLPFFFAREKKRENGGERVGWWWGSRRDYSLLESGFWGRKAQESVNLASLGGWGGSAGRGVLGGLIRRMLSHHPSRQAAENWLAPRRVEFTGGAGGGGGGEGMMH